MISFPSGIGTGIINTENPKKKDILPEESKLFVLAGIQKRKIKCLLKKLIAQD